MRSPSPGLRAGSLPQRSSMSASIEGASGEVCITMKSDAGKSAGNLLTSTRSASMPPADAPRTTISFGIKRSLHLRRVRVQGFDGGIKIQYTYTTCGGRITQSKTDRHTRGESGLHFGFDWAPEVCRSHSQRGSNRI